MRIIAKLEIKENHVIKPVQYEGLRKVGDPETLLEKYYKEGADEILLINIVSSLYNTSWMESFLKKILKKVFIPITVGGGIKTLDQAKNFFDHGVDKVTICTSLFEDKNLIEKLSKEFGSQSVVASIQAMIVENEWYAFKEMARKNTKIKIIDWIKECVDKGAGEILVTSVKRDGLMKGLDLDLYNEICDICNVPLIIGGGFNGKEKLINFKRELDGITVSSLLHYNKTTIREIKKNLTND
jgi:imidazole glycerol-phosphate synthase subunit HisF